MMADGKNEDEVAGVVETDAVVAGTEPELGRVDVLEALHIAFASREIAGEGFGGCGGRRLGR